VREACPAAATIDVEWLFRYNGAATPPDAPELGLAAAAIERNFGRRPALVRSGAGLPLLETSAARGIPAIATGFAVESEANMHGPNESFRRAHVGLGITTVSELLGALRA
jgi:acetylornithine deacetylase/succinyl-diaminopimelate desuccinylase-like protein